MARAKVAFALLLSLAFAGVAAHGESTAVGGFSLENLRVPAQQLIVGGPGRDGIRSVDEPRFAPLAEVRWVSPDGQVLGVALDGIARAYPVHVMERHQIVNDRFGTVPIAVTYDPLAGVPLAFRRTVDGQVLDFGVSGLIYNSNFLLYDRQTESLWSQFRGEALAGPLAGKRLERVTVRQETLTAWGTRHADTAVLRLPMPGRIDYRLSPFQTYWGSPAVPFPVNAEDRRFHPKEVVVGVSVGEASRAYLGSIVMAAGGAVDDTFQGARIQLSYDTESATFQFDVPPEAVLTEAYWLAWKAFHPETGVWRDPGSPEQ